MLSRLSAILFPPLCCCCGCFLKKGSSRIDLTHSTGGFNPHIDGLNPLFCCVCEILVRDISSNFQKKIFLPVSNGSDSLNIRVYAVSDYTGSTADGFNPLRQLILRKNSSGFAPADRLASRQLGQILYEFLFATRVPLGANCKGEVMPQYDFIVPVPLHWTRYARRGFNQSYEMAKILGKNLGIPVIRLLKRSRRTIFQAELSAQLRQENVQNAFIVRKKYQDSFCDIVRDKNILFVDDLYTTGATLKNAIKVILNPRGPKLVSAVVVCCS